MEFAFVLLPLLLLTIGTLLYGLVFVTQQAMAFGAQRGADALVQLDPDAFDSVQQLCESGAADTNADERVRAFLPDVGLIDPDTVDAFFGTDTAGTEGCFVEVENAFFLQIPLLPLPQTLRGVGFVPVS